MKLTTILLFVLSIFIFSCQKEARPDTVTPPLPPTPVSDDSIYLSQFIKLDTTKAAPNDTITKINFYYDDKKRNIAIDYIDYYEGAQVIVYKTKFLYNGNDTVPAKLTFETVDLPVPVEDYENDTSYFFYQNGILIKDSTISVKGISKYFKVNKYDYFSDRIINSQTFVSNPDTNYYTDTFYIQKMGSNIVQQNLTSINTTQNFAYTYDTKPNPFYRTQAKYSTGNRFPLYDTETYVEEIFARNNALEINQNFNNNNYHFKFVYEYKSNGYPSIVRGTDLIFSQGSFKGIYLYTN